MDQVEKVNGCAGDDEGGKGEEWFGAMFSTLTTELFTYCLMLALSFARVPQLTPSFLFLCSTERKFSSVISVFCAWEI